VAVLRASPTERFVNALAEIADANPGCQHELRRLGVLPLLSRLLDATDTALRHKAIVALATLCNGNSETCQAATALGLVQRLTALLPVADTRNLAAMALATIADRNATAQDAATSALAPLAAMLGSSPEDPLRCDDDTTNKEK
jgi:hypothetical protein